MQIWVGSKQKQLQLGSMQLMHEYVPQATLMLAILVPLLEPMGLQNPGPGEHRALVSCPHLHLTAGQAAHCVSQAAWQDSRLRAPWQAHTCCGQWLLHHRPQC